MPATKTPTWEPFVSHYDSVGQAPTMVAAFSLPKTTVSLLFDRMAVSLQGNDKSRLAASIGLAGYFAIALPDEFALRGFLLTARGKVFKTFDTSAVLTLSIGQSARVVEWPMTSKIVTVTGGTPTPQTGVPEFDLLAECFSSDEHLAIGDPPTFPPIPPLTISIGMHARRPSTEGTVLMTLDGIDISMLNFI